VFYAEFSIVPHQCKRVSVILLRPSLNRRIGGDVATLGPTHFSPPHSYRFWRCPLLWIICSYCSFSVRGPFNFAMTLRPRPKLRARLSYSSAIDRSRRAYKFRVFISGHKRGVTPKIKLESRRRSAIEPVIGHLKAEHRVGRNFLGYRQGNACNAVLP
jgi:hypothetical protein